MFCIHIHVTFSSITILQLFDIFPSQCQFQLRAHDVSHIAKVWQNKLYGRRYEINGLSLIGIYKYGDNKHSQNKLAHCVHKQNKIQFLEDEMNRSIHNTNNFSSN